MAEKKSLISGLAAAKKAKLATQNTQPKVVSRRIASGGKGINLAGGRGVNLAGGRGVNLAGGRGINLGGSKGPHK